MCVCIYIYIYIYIYIIYIYIYIYFTSIKITIQVYNTNKIAHCSTTWTIPREQLTMTTPGPFRHKIKNYSQSQLRCHKNMSVNETIWCFNNYGYSHRHCVASDLKWFLHTRFKSKNTVKTSKIKHIYYSRSMLHKKSFIFHLSMVLTNRWEGGYNSMFNEQSGISTFLLYSFLLYCPERWLTFWTLTCSIDHITVCWVLKV